MKLLRRPRANRKGSWLPFVRLEASSGQAILLIAVGIVGLLAFTGLAIDGGRLLLLQRDARNATDAAAAAAALQICLGGDYTAAAQTAVANNGFDHTAPETTLTIEKPPLAPSPVAGDNRYVEITLNSSVPGTLIQLAFQGPLETTVVSAAGCGTFGGSGPPFAVFAGSDTCSDTINWTGNNTTIIGDLHSNNDYTQPSNNGSVTGTGTFTGTYTNSGNSNEFNGTSCDGEAAPQTCYGELIDTDTTQAWPLILDINDFAPGGSWSSDPNYHDAGSSEINAAWLTANGFLAGSTITQGIYYTTGNINLNINSLAVDVPLAGITLVAEGTIQLSGNSQSLRPYADNILMFSTFGSFGCNTTAIRTEGENNYWRGIVYAPEGRIETSGNMTGTVFEACLLGNTVLLNGSDMTLECDPSLFPPEDEVVFVE